MPRNVQILYTALFASCTLWFGARSTTTCTPGESRCEGDRLLFCELLASDETIEIEVDCSPLVCNEAAKDCSPERICGDGLTSIGEFCDDGNLVDGDGCNSLCKKEFCGDAIINGNNPKIGIGPEECDDGGGDGGAISGDGCDAFCRIEQCGNGRIESNEACDDGNTLDGDGCPSTCIF